jgi:hypothetical protein
MESLLQAERPRLRSRAVLRLQRKSPHHFLHSPQGIFTHLFNGIQNGIPLFVSNDAVFAGGFDEPAEGQGVFVQFGEGDELGL